jgi:uncharacterized membrane protein/predicted DsbA family dithiol-disulfide isomerase
MSKIAARLALLCTLAGLLASSVAAYVHYRMLTDPTYVSFCDVSATVSCTEAYTSRFGTFHGIPVALFGVIWFGFATLLALTAMMGRPEAAESAPAYLFAGSTLALAVVLYLGYASFAILNVVCLVCLTTYAAVIGLFLVTGAATTVPMMSLPRRAVADLKVLVASPLAIVLALLWAGGTVSAVAFFPRDQAVAAAEVIEPSSGGAQGQTEVERFMATQPRVPLVISAGGAKVLVVKFADYQCPACGQAYVSYKPIFEKYEAAHPGEVRLVMKDYPLNPECNANLTSMLHPSACDAAVAVRLAREHDRGPQMEDWFYTHQEQMTPAVVRQQAKDIGGVTDFEAKYAATLDGVKSDIALGKSLHVTQTPTFFVDGVKIEGMMAPALFDQAIAYELQHPR